MKTHLRHPHLSFCLLGLGLGLLAAMPLWFFLNWPWYWAWWTGLSGAAFFCYGLDKLQARRQTVQRIPELSLHLLALAGGVAGAWVGRFFFRHKTRHFGFTVILLLATVLHLALWYYVLRSA